MTRDDAHCALGCTAARTLCILVQFAAFFQSLTLRTRSHHRMMGFVKNAANGARGGTKSRCSRFIFGARSPLLPPSCSFVRSVAHSNGRTNAPLPPSALCPRPSGRICSEDARKNEEIGRRGRGRQRRFWVCPNCSRFRGRSVGRSALRWMRAIELLFLTTCGPAED